MRWFWLVALLVSSVRGADTGKYTGSGTGTDGWGAWTGWGPCKATCGRGLKERSRNCEGPASLCEGLSIELAECSSGLKCPIDGKWSPWGTWTSCTATCGDDGKTTRSRQCDNPPPRNDGEYCPGQGEIVARCNVKCCPEDGGWGQWNNWGRCSRTCGEGGAHIRKRLCNDPVPSPEPCPGKLCNGSDVQVHGCNRISCPVDGGWTLWSAWSRCSKTCGRGEQNRGRTCTSPIPVHQGEACNGPNVETRFCILAIQCPMETKWSVWIPISYCSQECGVGGHFIESRYCIPGEFNFGADFCNGSATQSTVCDVKSCPIPPEWTFWTCWSSCSVTCGKGKRQRTRECKDPSAATEGREKACPGQAIQKVDCHGAADSCAVDGDWSSWEPWSTCDKDCGGGIERRYRVCEDFSDTGTYCEGRNSQEKACNTAGCAIDGNWGGWTCWSDCTVTCGSSGHRNRVRHCDNPAPAHGGSPCSGKPEDEKPCDGMPPCPRDGEWSFWSQWSAFNKICGREAIRRRDRVCNKRIPIGGGETCVGPCVELDNQDLTACPQNGSWSQWGCWSGCSITCGNGGKQTRKRQCTHPPPSNGGLDCSGHVEEVKECNKSKCARNGTFTPWSNWTPCSQSCGLGYQDRSRDCLFAINGGLNCRGERNQVKTCFNRSCPVDGGWSSWGCWSPCNVTCGKGEKIRYRECNNPIRAHDGLRCPGTNNDTAICVAAFDCPEDGKWGNWTAWGDCSVTCGHEGIRRRQRTCEYKYDDSRRLACVGPSEEIGPCNRDVECPRNGGWSAWSEWGLCSAACGVGSKNRTRTCTNPARNSKGERCKGASDGNTSCFLVDCPNDGSWGQWSGWTDCSASCNGGSQKRDRHCDKPRPRDGGNTCKGRGMEFRECSKQRCPCDGQYSDWSEWTSCSVTCGPNGQQQRKRNCTSPSLSHEGATCNGHSTESQSCSAKRPCAQDGSWTSFGGFSGCSRECGGGIKVALRDCSMPPPTNGGKECIGRNMDVKRCNTQPCPCDGQWGNWNTWSKCNENCGIGYRHRRRDCDAPAPNQFGEACTGEPKDEISCLVVDCPIDGGWSEWGPYDQVGCANRCGKDAITVRRRTCSNPEPQNGGNNCVGPCTDYAQCNVSVCPCNGSWTEWGSWSSCDISCKKDANSVGGRHRNRTCTSPEPVNGGHICHGNKTEHGRCEHLYYCPVDGAWSKWSNWTSCSATCGGGVHHRVRACDSPAPRHKGNYCPGVSRDERACNTFECPCDGGYAQWGPWSFCSVSCGKGTRERLRLCVNPQPAHGGKQCAPPHDQTTLCSQQFQCPQDKKWSNWIGWSGCAASCGTDGMRQRWRVCQTPQPEPDPSQPYVPSGRQLGGLSCIGKSHELEVCQPSSEICEYYLKFQPKYVCTAPPPLTDGSYRITGHGSDAFGYTPTSTATYDCDKNLPGLTLRLEGSVLSECKDDGTWSDVKRECVAGELSTDRFRRNIGQQPVEYNKTKRGVDHAAQPSSIEHPNVLNLRKAK